MMTLNSVSAIFLVDVDTRSKFIKAVEHSLYVYIPVGGLVSLLKDTLEPVICIVEFG
jgi:hypothetical protein